MNSRGVCLIGGCGRGVTYPIVPLCQHHGLEATKGGNALLVNPATAS